MKNWYLFLLIAFFASSGLQAQDWGLFPREESLFVGERDSLVSRRGYSPIGNRFFIDFLKRLDQDPLNYLHAPVKDFTASSFSYTHESGDFAFGAAPGSSHELELSTSGLSRNRSGWVFFGDFSIKKTYLKDLKWNLSYQFPEEGLMEDPHYFGVERPAPWSNQEYNLNGGMILPLLKDKLHLLTRVNYRLFNKYRTDLDPRAGITYNRLSFDWGLGYQLSPQHHLKLEGSYAYAHVGNDIGFSNRNQNIPANYERYTKWVAGYGYLVNPFNNSTKRRHRGMGVNFGYTHSGEDYLIMADAAYEQRRQRTYNSAEIEDEDDPRGFFATYEPRVLRASLSALKYGEDGLWKLRLEGKDYSAGNILHSKGGKTYAAEIQELEVDLAYLRQLENGSTDLELRLRLGAQSTSQRDALARTHMKVQDVKLGLYAQKILLDKRMLNIFPFAEMGMVFPLQSEFQNGNAANLENLGPQDYAGMALRSYYHQVLLPDFELLNTQRFKAEVGANFRSDFKKSFQYLLQIKGGYKSALEELEYFPASSPHRFSTQVSFTIYY